MKYIDINNDKRIYRGGTITTDRSGHDPMSEPEMLELLAAAITLHEALEGAIKDMRDLLAEGP